MINQLIGFGVGTVLLVGLTVVMLAGEPATADTIRKVGLIWLPALAFIAGYLFGH